MPVPLVPLQEISQLLDNLLVCGVMVKVVLLGRIVRHVIELARQAVAFAGPTARSDAINELPPTPPNRENTIARMVDNCLPDRSNR